MWTKTAESDPRIRQTLLQSYYCSPALARPSPDRTGQAAMTEADSAQDDVLAAVGRSEGPAYGRLKVFGDLCGFVWL